MKAITTYKLPATNFKGARIVATDEDGNRVTISYPYEFSGMDVFNAAAVELQKKMNWSGKLIGGATKRGYVFVFAPEVEHRCAYCGTVIPEGRVTSRCDACLKKYALIEGIIDAVQAARKTVNVADALEEQTRTAPALARIAAASVAFVEGIDK